MGSPRQGGAIIVVWFRGYFRFRNLLSLSPRRIAQSRVLLSPRASSVFRPPASTWRRSPQSVVFADLSPQGAVKIWRKGCRIGSSFSVHLSFYLAFKFDAKKQAGKAARQDLCRQKDVFGAAWGSQVIACRSLRGKLDEKERKDCALSVFSPFARERS